MKLLTIGNSFSVNACRYLDKICEGGGIGLVLGQANLGGCSLERHWANAVGDIPAYGSEFGGDKTLCELLTSEKWDFVTLQQASPLSWRIGTYYPYIDILADFVRKHAPGAELVIHQTWAYRSDNERLRSDFRISQSQMFMLIKQNYNEISERLGARILPVGEAFRIMQDTTGDRVGSLTRRDDAPSHANELGEYIGGLVWYSVLTGGDIDAIGYVPESVGEKYVQAAKKSAAAAVAMCM